MWDEHLRACADPHQIAFMRVSAETLASSSSVPGSHAVVIARSGDAALAVRRAIMRRLARQG
jgi:nitrate reductase gamma subunit